MLALGAVGFYDDYLKLTDRKKDGLTMREQYDPSLPPVKGDEDQLIQVFLNLVKNAAEAAHARGDGRGIAPLRTP